MRTRLAALLLLLAVVVPALAVGGMPSAPSFVVDPEAERLTAGVTPWGIGFPGEIPRLLHREELKLPPGHPLRRIQYTFVIEGIVAPSGRIARARILRGPDTPGVRAAIVEALKGWLYAPAKLNGKPTAVYQVFALSTPAPRG